MITVALDAPDGESRQIGGSIESATETPARAEFTSQMERRFDDLGRRFQEMEIRQMKKGEIAARQKLEAAKKSVAEKSEEFERTLKRARRVGDEAWDDVSAALRGAWIEMKEAVDRAQAEFAGDTASAEQSEGAG